MLQARDHKETFMTITEISSDDFHRSKEKQNILLDITYGSIEDENLLIVQPVLSPEYRTLYEY